MGELYDGNATRSYFQMILDYNKIVLDLDKAFIWNKAISSIKNSQGDISETTEN